MTREMKDSGVEWIKKVPTWWKQEKIKWIINERRSGSWGIDYADDISSDNASICLRIADFDFMKGRFVNKNIEDLTYRTYTKKELNVLKLKKGNILIEKSGGGEKTPVGRAVLFDKDYHALYANFMECIIIDERKVSPSFCEYWLQALYFCNTTPYYINQTTGIQNLNLTLMFSEQRIFYPSISEQKQIADYLDKKCGEIDSITNDIQKQIEVLEQYKRSTIIEAVTKGLNPNAKMKDSGIRYIGKIPAHWNTDKLKYHLKRNEPRNPGNKQVLSLYREYGVIPKDSRDDNHNITSEDTSKYKYVSPGDFVINKMKAWQGSVGISDYEGIISPAYFVYKFSDSIFVKKYFHYLLRSCYKDEFRRLSGGIREGQWDLSPEGLENTVLLIPTQEEQKEIANYLDKKCGEIDSVIADKKAQLETIEKYKKSLIYEYVTGKKEVVDE